MPPIAWHQCTWNAFPFWFTKGAPVNKTVAQHARRAYYAATSFADHLVGRVLDTMDELGVTDKTITITAVPITTIAMIKSVVWHREDIPKDHQSLIFNDQQLEDGCTLSDYNIQKNDTIRLALPLRGGGKRARNTKEGVPSKEETIQDLTDELNALTLQLNTSDIQAINQIIQNVSQQLQQTTAEQAMSSLSAEDLHKVVGICAYKV